MNYIILYSNIYIQYIPTVFPCVDETFKALYSQPLLWLTERRPSAAAVLQRAVDFPAAAPAAPNRRPGLQYTRTLRGLSEAWGEKNQETDV